MKVYYQDALDDLARNTPKLVGCYANVGEHQLDFWPSYMSWNETLIQRQARAMLDDAKALVIIRAYDAAHDAGFKLAEADNMEVSLGKIARDEI